MTLRERIEGLFETQVVELTGSPGFRALERGVAWVTTMVSRSSS